jgi:hypothetical protein
VTLAITLSASSGPVGTAITVVSGTGFTLRYWGVCLV